MTLIRRVETAGENQTCADPPVDVSGWIRSVEALEKLMKVSCPCCDPVQYDVPVAMPGNSSIHMEAARIKNRGPKDELERFIVERCQDERWLARFSSE
jgi:hypothetical protein